MVMIKLDQCGQSSAEILLIVAAALALVLIAGYVAVTVSKTVGGNVSDVVDAARNSTLLKLGSSP
ncbi:hypothetical protein Mfer_0004 [Methanothermus fervidus DSM 2088]|uniref:Class III signal peptide-containing protein n=1 Tax=Methanothermus fervidus (strain ATCC 43054 / DSM 2088 / JCM 10308 / V24 S) TaxID=523846 RepID=E3GWJ5_METFV|nr:hypothetical protein [Methanothermus fervidus]ADP76809.1 hypothetical protein Mfer_0004 [Methanothermus fervidus DSM 2088]